jgi:hypothetical protein
MSYYPDKICRIYKTICDLQSLHFPGDTTKLVTKKFSPILTHFVNNFKISSTVPVCCIAVECNVTLCAVEQKKVTVRHNLLRVNI